MEVEFESPSEKCIVQICLKAKFKVLIDKIIEINEAQEFI